MSSNIYKIRLIIGAQKQTLSPQIKLFQGYRLGASCERDDPKNRDSS